MKRSIGYSRLASIPGVALLAFAVLGEPVAAQVTAAQQSAIRSNCRSDFMSKCSGVTPGGKDALACLQKNVTTLSAGCKTAVSATLPPPAPAAAAPAPAQPVQAAPAPAPVPATAAATPPPAPPPPAVAAKPATPAVVSAPPPRAKVTPPPRRAPATAAVAAPKAPAPAAVPAPPTAAQQSAMKASCRSDFMSKCSGVAPGGKEALGCLQKNVTTLSAACKKVVGETMAPGAAPAAVTPVAVTPAAPAPRMPKAPLANAVVMLRACKLDLIRHCRGVEPGGGRELACLAAHEDNLTIRCKTARKVTAPLR